MGRSSMGGLFVFTNTVNWEAWSFFMRRASHQHHRRNSSISSLSASAAGDPDKIQRQQALDRWCVDQADLCPDFSITAVRVHAGLRCGRWFVLECTSPDGHWMVEKSLPQLYRFQKELERVFPVEAGSTGKPRILPLLPWIQCLGPLLKGGIYAWYMRRISCFMRHLLSVSILVAKSRVVGEFLKSDMVTEAQALDDEGVACDVEISGPFVEGQKLACRVVSFVAREPSVAGDALLRISFQSRIYPVLLSRHSPTLRELLAETAFLSSGQGPVKMWHVDADGREACLCDNDDLAAFLHGPSRHDLLYMDTAPDLHE